ELRRVLRPGGQLRALEHVRSLRPWRARLEDAIQPAWTWLAGGCHPNRDTERAVQAAGLAIEAEGRRAGGNLPPLPRPPSVCEYNALGSMLSRRDVLRGVSVAAAASGAPVRLAALAAPPPRARV